MNAIHLIDSTICVFRDGIATSKGGPTFDQVRVRANYGFGS